MTRIPESGAVALEWTRFLLAGLAGIAIAILLFIGNKERLARYEKMARFQDGNQVAMDIFHQEIQRGFHHLLKGCDHLQPTCYPPALANQLVPGSDLLMLASPEGPAGQERRIFFIRLNSQGEPSLFVGYLGPDGRFMSRELITGVENMQLQYGLDADGDGMAEAYVSAAALSGSEWHQVVVLRIGLLLRSRDGVRSQPDTHLYQVVGMPVGVDTAIRHPVDGRFRQVITTTIPVGDKGLNLVPPVLERTAL